MLPVVALHSSLSSSAQWRSLKRKWKNTEIFTPDLIGYGEQPLVDAYSDRSHSLEEEITKLAPIIDSMPSFHLVGHSFGGATAIKIAHIYGDKIRSLTLFEPVAFYLFDFEDSIQQTVNHQFGTFKQQTLDSPREAACHFIDFWNGKGTFETLPHIVTNTFSKQIYKVQMDFEAITEDPLKLNDLNFQCPVHLLYGDSTRQLTKEIAKAIALHCDGQLTKVSGGHMAPLNNANEVNYQIINFISNLI